jgi:SAM-dependent methyltransferase
MSSVLHVPAPPPESRCESAPACECCGAGERRTLFEAYGWPIVECLRCGHARSGLRLFGDDAEEAYAESYYDEDNGYAARQLEPPSPQEIAIFSDLAKTARRIGHDELTGMDVGCGAGRMVAAMDAAGWRGLGIEPSARASQLARRAGRDVRQGFLKEGETPDDLTLVTSFHVLEHVPQPGAFLNACRAALRPDGLLMIEVPDFGCRASRRLRDKWSCLHPDLHLHQFTRRSLGRFLEDAGFAPLRWSKVGGRGWLAPQAPVASGALSSQAAPRRPGIKQRIFEARKWFYRLPGGRRFARWATWEVLGGGEAIRVLALRS